MSCECWGFLDHDRAPQAGMILADRPGDLAFAHCAVGSPAAATSPPERPLAMSDSGSESGAVMRWQGRSDAVTVAVAMPLSCENVR